MTQFMLKQRLEPIASVIREVWRREWELNMSVSRNASCRARLSQSWWDGEPEPEGGSGEPPLPLWFSLADYVVKKGFDPFVFVVANRPGPECGHPRKLKQPSAVTRYNAYLLALPDVIEAAYERQNSIATTEFVARQDLFEDEFSVWIDVLCDGGLALSALYRVCALHRLRQICRSKDERRRLKKILQLYFSSAATAYVPLREIYDKVWDNFIPDAFRTRAIAQYVLWSKGLGS